jgi:hypothetical protein
VDFLPSPFPLSFPSSKIRQKGGEKKGNIIAYSARRENKKSLKKKKSIGVAICCKILSRALLV